MTVDPTTRAPSAPDRTSDRKLVARIAAGDGGALAEAYQAHGGLVFGLARRVLRDETFAEDVTQEVFTALWQHPDGFDARRGSLRTWLGLLAHRRSVDRVRAEARRARRETRADEMDRPEAGQDVVDRRFTEQWIAERVRDALAQLPTEQRDAVVLAYYRGRSYREVAIELAIPEGTAKSRVRLALRKLDELLRASLSDQDTPAWT